MLRRCSLTLTHALNHALNHTLTHTLTQASAILIAAATVCGLAGSAMAATPRDMLVVAMAFDDIISLDPAEAFEPSTAEVLGNSYERLIRLDPSDPSQLEGELASSWKVSADGRTFSFEIKPGLKFASGNPLGAEDVAWSLQRAVMLDKTPAFILAQFGLAKENAKQRIKATGARTVELTTDSTFAPSFVLNCLTAGVASVVDKRLLLSKERDGDLGHAWLKTNYAGSGPLKIREWRANEVVALERNEHHAGASNVLARVIYRHLKESATQRLLLEKGDVDIARNLGPLDLQALAARSDIKTVSRAKGTLYYIGLNQRNPNLAKPEVREALKWLVDYQGIADTIVKNIGVVHQSFLPEGMLGASAKNPYKLDVPRARALLAKAGLAKGFKVTMDTRSKQPETAIAEALQQTMKQAGVELEIVPGDGKQVVTKYRARRHEMFIGIWGADYWDPHTNADTFARNPDNGDDAKAKTLAWRNAWVIPALTKKADAAVREPDTQRRRALYEDLQSEVRDRSPFVILFQEIEVAAYRSNLQGLRLGPTSDANYLYTVSKP
jgi:peptide/nickel transport system substrate-binding protein